MQNNKDDVVWIPFAKHLSKPSNLLADRQVHSLSGRLTVNIQMFFSYEMRRVKRFRFFEIILGIDRSCLHQYFIILVCFIQWPKGKKNALYVYLFIECFIAHNIHILRRKVGLVIFAFSICQPQR